MLNVFLTVDVEIWCDGWTDLDRKFPDAFQRYVYGATPRGEFGLRYQAEMLRSHGLTGVFFVEPLFAGRFGDAPLAEIVGLLHNYDQEIQLHLHTEWLDEWREPLFADIVGKRQFLRQFSREQQQRVIAEGKRLLARSGAAGINCFRAGSFGFNADTLDALSACAITFDSSYNATAFGLDSGVAQGMVLTQSHRERGVTEYPMTVYDTGLGRLRHAQLGACSWAELEGLLWSALESGRDSFVLLLHNFELLTPSKANPDPAVLSRFKQLCRFLDQNRDKFNTRGFSGLEAVAAQHQPPPLRSSLWRTALRNVEQISRRRFV